MSSGPVIMKQAGISRVVPYAVWVFCVLASADAIIEGTTEFAIHTGVLMAAIALTVWIVLQSPHFAVDSEGVTIVNPARVVTVPFGALVDLRVGAVASVLTRLATGRERKVTSWNAPGVQRRRPTPRIGTVSTAGAPGMTPYETRRSASLAGAGRPATPATTEIIAVVDRFRTPWETAHPEGDSAAVATIAWRWREWLVLAGLVAANVAIRLR